MPSHAHTDRFAEIAVGGPLRRTFTYALPADCPPLSPGQRVLVPFGTARKVGFYLGPGTPPDGITVKPIHGPLDPFSYFPDDLFRLCSWMADYYFANPADCLTAALPPAVKSEAAAQLLWCDPQTDIPAAIRSLVRPGKRLTPADLKSLRDRKANLRALIADGLITEHWPASGDRATRRLSGYRAAATDIWESWFEGKKLNPRPFDGTRTRAELLADGWTPHYLGKAIHAGLLEAVHIEDTADLYDIVRPRENVDRITMTAQQQAVYEQLRTATDNPAFRVFLLHGVTGSGKTLVYCHLTREVINTGRTVLILTPEIALTGTTLAYFRGFFGDRVTVIHSAMTDRERLASFSGIRAGKFNIVIGPRSAIFAPLPNLGLIVVDEEHDASYKQDEPAPRFHGRDCAIIRAQMNKIPVVLGSASPSIESYYAARTGKYTLLELAERPAGATLPTVRVIDMRTERLHGDLPFLSFPLKKEVEKRLAANEQVILFLNRRGYSPQLKCGRCGKVPSCPNCRVKLTYHKVGRKLSCHYCGWVEREYDTCPSCGATEFFHLGAGTQRVEEMIPRLFDGALGVRLDSDTATGKRRLHEILTDFAAGKSNLLLGTQMVTKGLDLPGVTLVGVLAADLLLDMPDFRASERTFAQLLQVAGRSGRADKPGEVLIQTYAPEHEVIDRAASQDYRGFYETEICRREELEYPPYSRIINFVLSGSDEKVLEKESLSFRDALGARLASAGDVSIPKSSRVAAQILGPAPCPMYFLRSVYRRHLFVKTRQVQRLVRLLSEWELSQARFGIAASIKITVDVDPDDMM